MNTFLTAVSILLLFSAAIRYWWVKYPSLMRVAREIMKLKHNKEEFLAELEIKKPRNQRGNGRQPSLGKGDKPG